ncbi:1,4-beta-D-glucan cellobiohydrolase-like protein [Tothia fuscella]|uniref:Glucanase n=1 Tax=Tothia fuscella TaxID=1048955 RepID=A0A9P4NIY6_9PEZI|nr:1,4-beta-D-glucan cellobiohydrolase-like protein [Tothia fuscella]
MYRSSLLFLSALATVRAQLVGTNSAETHPGMQWQNCAKGGSCSNKAGKLVLDANWRWAHQQGGSKNCYTDNDWDRSICTDNKACATKCAIDGADYQKTYGVTAGGNSLKLKFLTKHQYGTSVGSRLYLMESDTKYQMFSLLNKEFTFDVDMSQVPCGLNAALYFVSMDADGGMAKSPNNKAGAKYGTGYCDAQCPRDLKFINGEASRLANVEGWTPSKNDKNAGVGGSGACCAEMDVWEANSVSTALTPHACKNTEFTKCKGDSCGGTYSETRYAGTCDPDGCDFNSYRMGDTTFYGKGKTVDTSKKMTVVTQFIGSPLKEIKRFYVQDGKVIPNSQSKIAGVTGNSITPEFCDAQKKAFDDKYTFKDLGGFASMSSALQKGMVLVMSLWDDHYSNMLWLDSQFPPEKASAPGGPRGECPASGGSPEAVEAAAGDASVTFSNIKFGDLNTTFKAT